MNFIYRTIQFGFMHIWPLLVMFFAAATLPADDLGTVAIIMSVATLFRPLVGLSLGRTTIRYAGEAYARDGEAGRNAAVGLALRLGGAVSVVSLLVALPVMVGVNHLYELESNAALTVYSIIFLYFFGVTEFLDGIFRTVGRFRQLAVSVASSRVLGLVLFSVLLPFYGSIDSMILFLAISEMVSVLLLLTGVRAMLSAQSAMRYGIASQDAKRMLAYATPIIINAISVYLYARVMVMIIGLYAPGADTGAFELAVQITNLPMAITIICASVMSPVIGRLVHLGEAGLREANTIASYGASFTVWVNAMAAVFLFIVAPMILKVWFPDFTALPVVLMIIAPLVAAKSFAQFVSGEIAIATGAAGTAAKITIAFGIVTVVLGLLMASRFGVMGGATAMLVSHLGAVLATVLILQKKTGLHFNYRLGATLTGSSIVAAASGIAVLAFRNDPVVAASLGTLVYFVALIGLVYGGLRLKSPLIEPLVDGLRMLKSKSSNGVSSESSAAKAFPLAQSDSGQRTDAILYYCALVAPDSYAFWLEGSGDANAIKWQDHADMAYTLRLLNQQGRISPDAAAKYLDRVADAPLYGRPLGEADPKTIPNAHMTAYILGAAKLVENATGLSLPERAFEGWKIDQIINPETKVPLYPKAWAHHIWRVSHWIGGGPSILFNLARWGRVEGVDTALVDQVLAASETHLLDSQTDLLRPYKSKFIQSLFRKAYKIKHDPEIADIGGVVHLLWVYHALGRPYRNPQPLFDKSWQHMRDESPFMEDVPYCLDFDIVQLVRTAQPAEHRYAEAVRARSDRFIADTLAYLAAIPDQGYTLHKVPGALATIHEASFISEASLVPGLEVPVVDIIREAGWL
ncbi:oligosaccharide flippase family protein [Arenibacterium sp. LLYu02]|uniref:oligosaccharide flippase family protein n=1 Tax=Arenibacterium sp. LLYu02 TaxID=3404132 RepID=UPI003B21F29C